MSSVPYDLPKENPIATIKEKKTIPPMMDSGEQTTLVSTSCQSDQCTNKKQKIWGNKDSNLEL